MLAAMRLTEIEVKTAIRIGKKSEDKPRPLIITLNSEREQVLRRARLIRRYKDWQNVFIDPDRTPLEQEEFRDLRAEFKKRREDGENIIMRDGKILRSTRKSSTLDLNTLLSQAENVRSNQNEDTGDQALTDKTPSVNLINFADSATNIKPTGMTEVQSSDQTTNAGTPGESSNFTPESQNNLQVPAEVVTVAAEK